MRNKKPLTQWPRALFGVLGVVVMLSGLFASFPGFADDLDVEDKGDSVSGATPSMKDSVARPSQDDAPRRHDLAAVPSAKCSGTHDDKGGWHTENQPGVGCVSHVTGKRGLVYSNYGAIKNDITAIVIEPDAPIVLVDSDPFALSNMPALTTVTGLENVDVSRRTSLVGMFKNINVNTLSGLENWNTENVNTMDSLFKGASLPSSLDLHNWNTGKVANMFQMFCMIGSPTALDLHGWNTSRVNSMAQMFMSSQSLTSVDLRGWTTAKTNRGTNMMDMFTRTKISSSLLLGGWDVAHATDMRYMFSFAVLPNSLDLSAWNVSNVLYMSNMFQDASIPGLNLHGWNFGKVKDMAGIFLNSKIKGSLNLGGWDLTGSMNKKRMFKGMYTGDLPNGNAGLTSLTLGHDTYVDPESRGIRTTGVWLVEAGSQGWKYATDDVNDLLDSAKDSHSRTDTRYKIGSRVEFRYESDDSAAVDDAVKGLRPAVVGGYDDSFDLKAPQGWRFAAITSAPASGSSQDTLVGDDSKVDEARVLCSTDGVQDGAALGCSSTEILGKFGTFNRIVKVVMHKGQTEPGNMNEAGDGSSENGGSNGGDAGNGSSAIIPMVPDRSVASHSGGGVPAPAPAPGTRPAPGKRGRLNNRQCVAWLDAGGDGVLSDYGPNGQVAPGQVRQVSDPCADQKSAVIGGAHGVRYVTWLPYFLSGALVGGFAMEAVYLLLRRLLRRRAGDGDDGGDGYGRVDGDDDFILGEAVMVHASGLTGHGVSVNY